MGGGGPTYMYVTQLRPKGNFDSCSQVVVLQGRLVIVADSPWVACTDLQSHTESHHHRDGL